MGMKIDILSGAKADILAHAEREHPREVCGILVGQGLEIQRAVPAANVAADPYVCYVIDPAVQAEVQRELRGGEQVVLGYYHSHPGGRPTPSPADAEAMELPGALWLIAAGEEIKAFSSRNGGYVSVLIREVESA